MQGSSDSADPVAREAIAKRDRPAHRRASRRARTRPTSGRYVFAGTARTSRRTRCPTRRPGADALPGLAAADRAPDRPGRVDRGQRLARRACSAAARARPTASCSTPCATSPRTCAPATAPALRGTDLAALDAQPRRPARRARASTARAQNRLEAALSRLAEVEEATLEQLSETEDADIAKTLIELQLPAGRLPGGPQGRGEHRPGLAHGLPPLIRSPEGEPVPMSLTFDSSRFGTLEIDARRRHRVPGRPDRPGRRPLRARGDRPVRAVRVAALDRRPRRRAPGHEPVAPLRRLQRRAVRRATPRGSAPEDPSEVDVWVTVRAAGELADFSCNLRAPIVVWKGRGHQVINEAPDAPVRAPLFPDAAATQAA